MPKPLPVGTDTGEPTALLYLNPIEYRAIRRVLVAATGGGAAALSESEMDTVTRTIAKLDGEATPYGS